MSRVVRLAHSLTLLGALGLSTGLAAQANPLPLVVEGVDAAPAGEVDLVVRTDAPGALASGAFVLEARDKQGGDAPAFAAVVSAAAYADGDDASAAATLDFATQTIAVAFESPSATLNQSFGPLVVVRLTLADGLVEDRRFDLRIVPGSVDLRSPVDEPVPALVGRGRMRMRTPVVGEADLGPTGAEVVPGDVAVFGALTAHPYPIGSGSLELLYDPAVATASPTVAFDPRYGEVVIDSLSEPEPGRLLIVFHSPGAALNATLYGRFLTVAVPTRGDIAVGVTSPVQIGPASALFDENGVQYLWEAEGPDVLDFIPAGLVLRVLFEAGDLFEWTATTG